MIQATIFRPLLAAIAIITLAGWPCPAAAAAPDGDLTGTIYADDLASPAIGAIVRLRDLVTGKIWRSSPTDKYGKYSLTGIQPGRFMICVTYKTGDFSFDYDLQVKAKKKAKLSLTLKPHASDRDGIMNETPIGRVSGVSAFPGDAQVTIERGLLQVGDLIHVKSEAPGAAGAPFTDFYQEVKSLKYGSAAVKEIQAGRSGALFLERPALVKDIVYLVWQRGVPPQFLADMFCGNTVGVLIIADLPEPLLPDGVEPRREEIEKSPSKK